MNKEKDYETVLLEDMNGKFDFLVELIVPLTVLPAQVTRLGADMVKVRKELAVIKRVIKDHSSVLKDNNLRLHVLETM